VCDGISTANAGSGDVASGITTHVIASLWEQAVGRLEEADDDERHGFLARSLRMANRAVCEAALRFAGGQMEGRIPMGTTAVVAIGHGSQINLAWLGDSRAYLVGPYGAALLTSDMNQASERLEAWVEGSLQTWDATGYALVGYVGHFNEWLRSEALPPQQISFKMLPGETLVLCSDGITDYISENNPETSLIIDQIVSERSCVAASRALVTRANEGGGGDNATAIVARLDTAWQDASILD
jgi:serine/threonine protein phosphatase PrpC